VISKEAQHDFDFAFYLALMYARRDWLASGSATFICPGGGDQVVPGASFKSRSLTASAVAVEAVADRVGRGS
jgi:hypothetical protein